MLKLPSSFSMIHIVEFLSISLLFLTLISSARSTRIKIGPKAWAYQIDLNQGNQMRQEFSDKNGVTNGFYQFRTDNQTKKLMYTIDPNRKEPDIVFNVVNVDHSNGLMMNDCNQFPNQSNVIILFVFCIYYLILIKLSNVYPIPIPELILQMTFDSIDSSDEDFKGHVTLKVANSSYNINFASGDRSNSREEVLSPNGLLYGRYNFMTKNNPQKIVINYKFNSTATDPTFEVSLFKSSILNDLEREQDRDSFDAIYHNHPNANLRVS
ncbi:hypothetical protein QR98_0048940 [Sarcoptes scabiei]|uniref:Uncharacterized protein n=1 Tax=Sarcoptes scabiei TaxID=52283 RepID=A0A132A697_SARSC|nr:hypothetical protein QR98_0048940 [Sarcoptes scabiei]